ncbi:hypothetical protein MKEN_00076600 [Mycena kentingensis (nom. inval.)]|nr:hypothetical protein MKEN_00076600 [Mycena kentingensis (nom. inval.)]
MRLLPRLLKVPLSGPFLPAPPKPRIRFKPVPQHPPIDPTRSILLTPRNVITNSSDYIHHKMRRSVFRPRNPTPLANGALDMTSHERSWWSNPYLRMLTSPIRQCLISQRNLPSDLLIRLASFRHPADPTRKKYRFGRVIAPDGILHSRFKRKRTGRAKYITCSRRAATLCVKHRWTHQLGGSAIPRLIEQISHHLRLRVLQELLLLVNALKRLQGTHVPVIRRLRRAEWAQVRDSGVIPYADAIAVLVLPPLNRNPESKQREDTTNALSDGPLEAVGPSVEPKRQVPPVCVLHRTSPSTGKEDDLLPSFFSAGDRPRHSVEKLPLFNGVPLIPHRKQRAKMYEFLTEILSLEGHARRRAGCDQSPVTDKASHAFLISASDEVDLVPLVIAMWRIRLWEGEASS